jgi:hypothetical protein
LLDLRRVAVAGDGVGVDPLPHLGVQVGFLGRSPGTGDTRLGVDDDVLGLDRAGGDERAQGQLRGGVVAARSAQYRGRLLSIVPV